MPRNLTNADRGKCANTDRPDTRMIRRRALCVWLVERQSPLMVAAGHSATCIQPASGDRSARSMMSSYFAHSCREVSMLIFGMSRAANNRSVSARYSR